MKIIAITPVAGLFIETDSGDYTRYGPNSWTETMGESEEPVSDCANLEFAFQEYMKSLPRPADIGA